MPRPGISCSDGARRVLLGPLWPAAPSRPATLPSRAATASTRTITTSTNRPETHHHHRQPLQPLQPQGRAQFPPSRKPTAAPPSHQARSYHSHDHPPPPGPFTPAEASLLSAAYAHVPAHGFTPEALALGARDAGLLDISPAVLPDGGVFALIRWHLHAQRAALAGKVGDIVAAAEGGAAVMTVGEKVEALTWARLRGNVEGGVVARWQEALAIMAQPSYIPASVRELAQLADEILYLAGDPSVDPSWYTKRASLSAVYAAAELFQTTDRSPEFRETRAFLRRRLDEAARAGGAVRSVGEWIGFNAGAAVNVLRSKGVRI
ncbi:hypothetical protein C8A01DRAFT_45730 [Parachaetomium inaequale]|uniref:Ubiquinone biosynthesis protein n=1 Tax=Parachaetomium inaequale TaxID=2588326 RepID=A0AAN6PHB7_9PEZI|nr:hypothetical protein C8A01DRAFT_45730 [Parachaetomium inaequale]